MRHVADGRSLPAQAIGRGVRSRSAGTAPAERCVPLRLSVRRLLSARRNDGDAEQQIRAALEATIEDAANLQGEGVVAEISRRRDIAISAGENENDLAVAGRARKIELFEDAPKRPATAAASSARLNGHVRGPRALAGDSKIKVRDAAVRGTGFVRNKKQGKERREKDSLHRQVSVLQMR